MAELRDLYFLGQSWEEFDVPKEKKYLLKYFDTPLQEAFLKYFFMFGEYSNFCDHTGIPCRDRWLNTLFERLQAYEQIHKQAKSNMDMTLLAKIEAGKYKL